jgi:hypothetical protein
VLAKKQTALLRDPEIFREWPLFVNPLRLAAEAGVARHLENFGCRVLVAALRPDRFALQKFDPKIRRRDTYSLPSLRLQVHFDTAGFVIDSG